MLFKLNVTDAKTHFKVDVLSITGELIHSCGWQGGEFIYKNKHYTVLGPYHNIEGTDRFRVWELVPVSEEV